MNTIIKKGNLMEWVTSGHELTMTIDSTEVKVISST